MFLTNWLAILKALIRLNQFFIHTMKTLLISKNSWLIVLRSLVLRILFTSLIPCSLTNVPTHKRSMFPPVLAKCPNCKENQAKTIESRTTSLSIRRRKECESCGHRFTVHEVSSEFFEESKQNQILIFHLRKMLGELPLNSGVESPPSGVSFKPLNKCSDCQHNKDGCYCAFEFPEYDTAESYDCNHFQLFKSKWLASVSTPTQLVTA